MIYGVQRWNLAKSTLSLIYYGPHLGNTFRRQQLMQLARCIILTYETGINATITICVNHIYLLSRRFDQITLTAIMGRKVMRCFVFVSVAECLPTAALFFGNIQIYITYGVPIQHHRHKW